MNPYSIPIKKFLEQPYSSILGYPKASKRQLKSRILELEKLGIKRVSFQGEMKLGSLNVLGKGYVGIVVLAKKNTKTVAVKIRRLDSPRKQMNNEAKLLKKVNEVKVGPKLLGSSKNFLIMEYLEGKKIGEWVKEIKGKGSAKKIKKIAKNVLEDCYKLDKAGIDHGELSTISKHVIIGRSKTTIIDFESSSLERKVSNVTSATQGIFIGSGISINVKRISKIPSKNKIITVLRNYKKLRNRGSFDDILKVLNLI